MADDEVLRIRWSLKHPLLASGLVALGCAIAGMLGALAAGGGVRRSVLMIAFFAVVAMSIFYSSARRQRARLSGHFA
jgi:hypothetical protein